MTLRLVPTLLALALSTPILAPASAHAATIDMKIDRAKVAVKADKKAIKDDKKDLKTIQKLRKKWEKARVKGKHELEAKVDVDLSAWARDKVAEFRSEVKDAAAEVTKGGGIPAPEGAKPPVYGPGHEVAKKPGPHGPAPQPTPNAAVAKDQVDLHKQRVARDHLIEVTQKLGDLQPRFTSGQAGPRAYQQKSKLLRELRRIAAAELHRSEGELTEDEAQLDRLKARK